MTSDDVTALTDELHREVDATAQHWRNILADGDGHGAEKITDGGYLKMLVRNLAGPQTGREDLRQAADDLAETIRKAQILGPTQEATCDRCGYHETLLAGYESIYCPRCPGYCLARAPVKPGAATEAERLLMDIITGDAPLSVDVAYDEARAYLVARGLLVGAK